MGKRECGTLVGKRPPIFVRPLTEDERQALEKGLRSQDAFVLRRSVPGVLGVLGVPDEQVWLRFVDGRPVSAITEQFLAWRCARLQALGVPVWTLIWDNASWRVSKAVRAWLRAHNRAVKQRGSGVRVLVCYLPVKSLWLNLIEPKWVHSKRAIVEPTRLLSAQEVADRVCAYHGCSHEPHLALPTAILDKAR